MSLIASIIFALHALSTKKKASWKKAGYSFLGIFIFSFIATAFKPPVEVSTTDATSPKNEISNNNTPITYIDQDKSVGWVGTPSKMFESCQDTAKTKQPPSKDGGLAITTESRDTGGKIPPVVSTLRPSFHLGLVQSDVQDIALSSLLSFVLSSHRNIPVPRSVFPNIAFST